VTRSKKFICPKKTLSTPESSNLKAVETFFTTFPAHEYANSVK
jgi:hypothetical protein